MRGWLRADGICLFFSKSIRIGKRGCSLAAQPTPIGNPGHRTGVGRSGPTTSLQKPQLPMSHPQRIGTPEEREPRELQRWGSLRPWRRWSWGSVAQEGCASGLRAPGIRGAGFAHLVAELRCRRPESGGRKRAMLLCRGVLMHRPGQSTGKWAAMCRVGHQPHPGSKGRSAPVREPRGARTCAGPGVEAQPLKAKVRRTEFALGDWGRRGARYLPLTPNPTPQLQTTATITIREPANCNTRDPSRKLHVCRDPHSALSIPPGALVGLRPPSTRGQTGQPQHGRRPDRPLFPSQVTHI